MRRRLSAAGIAMVIGGTLATVGNGRAQDEPFPVELRAGETFDACASGQIVCPARAPICDDPNVAIPVDISGGLGFKGVGPGSTICSAASAVGPHGACSASPCAEGAAAIGDSPGSGYGRR